MVSRPAQSRGQSDVILDVQHDEEDTQVTGGPLHTTATLILGDWIMNAPSHAVPHHRRRLYVGLVAILASAVIATLAAAGAVNPYPNLKLAYLLCVTVGVFGLIQLVIALTSRSPQSSPERTADG